MKGLCWSSALAEVPYELSSVRPLSIRNTKSQKWVIMFFLFFYMKLKSRKVRKVTEPDF